MPGPDLAPYRPIALDDLVRVGRDHDGGYVIPRRALSAARALVGLGISADWSFEEAFARANPGARVVGVDGSVSAAVFRRWARDHFVQAWRGALRAKRSVALPHLRTACGHLGDARALTRFFDGRDRRFVSRYFGPADGPDCVCWATLCREHGLPGGGDGGVFLKMDIEGAEYQTLGGLLAHADCITGAVVEFHDLDREWDRFAELMDACCGPFAVAHLHGNNWAPLIPGTRTPTVLEVSFVNRRLLDAPPVPSAAALPLPGLDMPCHPERPDYALAF
jgi:hypothetical protein